MAAKEETIGLKPSDRANITANVMRLFMMSLHSYMDEYTLELIAIP